MIRFSFFFNILYTLRIHPKVGNELGLRFYSLKVWDSLAQEVNDPTDQWLPRKSTLPDANSIESESGLLFQNFTRTSPSKTEYVRQ